MICPQCYTAYTEEETFCQRCGADLLASSKSLVPVQQRLPALLQHPQLPRVAVGVGAVMIGVSLTLLRRGLFTRLFRSARTSAKLLPTLTSTSTPELFSSAGAGKKSAKLPKGYVVQETALYMSRTVRRER